MKWILPFDGNCFLSHNGFEEIKSQLDRFGHNTKYFVVPMTRLLNNSVLLNDMDEKPKTPEEPQLVFRYDSEEEYNPNMRYGRRSKVSCLVVMVLRPFFGGALLLTDLLLSPSHFGFCDTHIYSWNCYGVLVP